MTIFFFLNFFELFEMELFWHLTVLLLISLLLKMCKQKL